MRLMKSILLTGASGYIGGRLLPVLEQEGHAVRCLVRNRSSLPTQLNDKTTVVEGNVLDPETLRIALKDVDTAYYMIHSMAGPGSFEEMDRRAAEGFADAARRAGVRRIVYLGGLGNEDDGLSAHLRSRQEVGEILRASRIPVVELRASIVIGQGSLSFEMIRALVNRLPVMVTPRWVSIKAQPIGIDDLISYLVESLHISDEDCRIYEVGGTDQVSYGEIMKLYATATGRRLRMLPVPVLTPYLSSLWLGLVTPLYARIGRKLIQSIVNSTVVRDTRALDVFPVQPVGIRESIERALASGRSPLQQPEILLTDSRSTRIPVSAAAAFRPIRLIGGRTGWYAWNQLWRIRGWLDVMVGGVGMRRGRPDRETLQIGDKVDFWEVIEYIPDRQLRLAAEMKVPGVAHLEFRVEPKEDGSSIIQTAFFKPHGMAGRWYWYFLHPIHQFVFADMLKGVAKAALVSADDSSDADIPIARHPLPITQLQGGGSVR